jgi:hypothetical protein
VLIADGNGRKEEEEEEDTAGGCRGGGGAATKAWPVGAEEATRKTAAAENLMAVDLV